MPGKLRFEVDLTGQSMATYEIVCVFGNAQELGAWNAKKALLLTRTSDYNKWIGEVAITGTVQVRYRYFVAAVSPEMGTLQVRRWETHCGAREHNMASRENTCADKFGCIDGSQCQVQRGWLNTGQIVLFKLFNATFPPRSAHHHLQLMLEAVDPRTHAPILPSPSAHVHYTLLRYGNSNLQEQPSYGVIYQPGDILLFQITTLNKDKVSYLFKLFACDRETDCVSLLSQVLVPTCLLQQSLGQLSVRFGQVAEKKGVLTFELDYLVILPMEGWQKMALSATFVDYWPERWPTLDIGHRGMGCSFIEKGAAKLTENTIGAMVESYKLGADFVEFDVLLTKDLVPVIHHDYAVKLCETTGAPNSESDLTPRLIKDLTYEELRNSKTYRAVGESIVAYPAANTVADENERLFPTLADFCTKINKMLGFNIEVKWPQLLYGGGVESEQSFDKNTFVDAILEVMRRFGWGRYCFFSSFDADICIMLRYKQNMYPVILLVSNTFPYYADPRTHCLLPAINTVQAFELCGIAPSANIFQRHPELVQLVKRQNKLIMLWGAVLCCRAAIDHYKQGGVHAVIYDHLESVLRRGRKNYFVQDTELNQLFLLQHSCSFK